MVDDWRSVVDMAYTQEPEVGRVGIAEWYFAFQYRQNDKSKGKE